MESYQGMRERHKREVRELIKTWSHLPIPEAARIIGIDRATLRNLAYYHRIEFPRMNSEEKTKIRPYSKRGVSLARPPYQE